MKKLPEEVKVYYAAISKKLLTFDVRALITRDYDVYLNDGKVLCKIGLVGRTLAVFLAGEIIVIGNKLDVLEAFDAIDDFMFGNYIKKIF